MSQPAPRQLSRQVALQVLYALDLRGERPRASGKLEEAGNSQQEAPPPAPLPADPDTAFAAVAENFELPDGARAFAQELVQGVTARRVELDATIAEHARNWRLARMAAVDRNVLRLATYELVATRTPTSVVLDQAIELARRFGDDPSPAFVNGVLDAVARSTRPGADRDKLGPGRGEAEGEHRHSSGEDL